MNDGGRHVCPLVLARALDSRFRSWLQNPHDVLAPYVRAGMTVLDFGCGPGFFTRPLAELVGPSGRVVAADLQQGMLDRLRATIAGTPLAARIVLHRSQPDRIGLTQQFDFVLAFYALHELPDQQAFFVEVRYLLAPQGQVLVVEPPLHVSRAAFEATLKTAQHAGLTLSERPRLRFNKAAILRVC